jgi:septum formation protein
LVLASRSSIRRKLLADAGVPFDVDAADVDEDAIGKSEPDPAARAMKLAEAKARVTSGRNAGRLVLGADQVGVLDDGAFLEKPVDEVDHVRMLLAMAGRTHTFHPAAVLMRDGAVLERVQDAVRVTFRAFGPEVARALAAVEGRGSCGGYESENRGAQLIARIEGSPAGAHLAVLGLPLLLVLDALRRVGGVEGVHA